MEDKGSLVKCIRHNTELIRTTYKQKELPYPLISDPNRTLIAALGANNNGRTKRSHYIFAKGGKLVDKKIPVTPTDRYMLFLILFRENKISCHMNCCYSPTLALEFVMSYSQ